MERVGTSIFSWKVGETHDETARAGADPWRVWVRGASYGVCDAPRTTLEGSSSRCRAAMSSAQGPTAAAAATTGSTTTTTTTPLAALQAAVLGDLRQPPSTEDLRGLVARLVGAEYVFQARARQAIRALVEDKLLLQHKLAILENAAGIADRATGDRLVDQLQRWQEENERQRATVAYLKIRIQMLETAAAQQDEYYRRNVADMTRQHNEQLQAIFRRHEETEIAFLAYQKSTSEDLAELARVRQDLAAVDARHSSPTQQQQQQQQLQQQQLQQQQQQQQQYGSTTQTSLASPPSSSATSTFQPPTTPTMGQRKSSKVIGNFFSGNNNNSDITQLQMELATARRRIQDIAAEKLTLTERLKMAEKLKDMKEQENNTLRENMTKMRKAMQDDVLQLQLQDPAAQDAEADAEGELIFAQDETGKKRLKGATAERLIDRLVDPAIHDHQYQVCIILTHKTFSTSSTMLDIILKKLCTAAASYSNAGPFTVGNTTHNKSSETDRLQMMRCANVLRFWILNYWSDFLVDKQMVQKLQDTLRTLPDDCAQTVKTALRMRMESTSNNVLKFGSVLGYVPGVDFPTTTASTPKPKPILPKFLAKVYQSQPNSDASSKDAQQPQLSAGTSDLTTNYSSANLPAAASGNNGSAASPGSPNMKYVTDTNKQRPLNHPASDLADNSALDGSDIVIGRLPPSTLADTVTGPQAIIGPNGAFQDFGFGPNSSLVPLDNVYRQIKFLEVDPNEFARQLTLIEFHLFRTMRSREFLNLSWMKDEKDVLAPNILRMMKWTNHVISWFITEIVSVKDSMKLRAATLEKVLAIGAALEKLNNFNGVKEVVAALNSSSVFRLRKTHESISTKYVKIFDDLVKLTSDDMNRKALRNRIHSCDPPLIPFPGLYQGDLVFLDTCNKDKFEGGLINFSKLERVTSTILELEAYQQVGYNLEPIKEIQDYIKFYEVLDEDSQYSASLQCEARSNT